MEPRIIKSKTEYHVSINEIERLVTLDPPVGSSGADRLELLATLAEDYEKKSYPTDKPTPIEAILFRMQEQGLRQKDLVPYIGNKSKVSEILNGKRQLTLPMIRALNENLGISLDVLTQEIKTKDEEINWNLFPISEMVKRKWITTPIVKTLETPRKIMEDFFALLGSHKTATIYCKSTKFNERTNRNMDKYALLAWVARISIKAKQLNISKKYLPGIVDDEFLKKIAQTSRLENGPIIVKDLLEDAGIPLIVEPHLPRTYIDGAAILSSDNKPIIALTIRHDRLDNFWHTLLHELAHVSRHLKNPEEFFVDNLDSDLNLNKKEVEADILARNSFIPRAKWERSDVFFDPSENLICEYADKWMIHPSIIAGRIRYETKNFYRFRQLVGYKEVRKLFPDISWAGMK